MKRGSAAESRRDARGRLVTKAIDRWFRASSRALPWRVEIPSTGRRDAYRSLVSEFMLQQTQVARVVPVYEAFLAEFPDVQALASASEQRVLARWSGLGYYRRARLLHAAARAIVSQHRGVVPHEPSALESLPGVGRYTAGAVASIVFSRRVAAVDGNVQRVLLRVEGRAIEETQRQRDAWVWERATRLVEQAPDPGRFNEGLMELGATVCTPASPHCDACPLATNCEAERLGLQGSIPPPKKRGNRSVLYVASILLRDANGRWRMEQRPATGLWANLWQPISLERADRVFGASEIRRMLHVTRVRHVGTFAHLTSHREVRFDVWMGSLRAGSKPRGIWCSMDEIASLPLGNAQRRVLTFVNARGSERKELARSG